MRKLESTKVFAQYRDIVSPYEPVQKRKYTITHSDETGELFVFIALKYAEDQVTGMHDEVRISWDKGRHGAVLVGYVIIDGEGVVGNADIRNTIFLKEMPTALQALRQADRFLFEKYPFLDNTPVYIHFISQSSIFNKTYQFGVIGDYKMKKES